MRSGTENVPAIMGFAKAVEIIGTTMVAEKEKVDQLKELFIEKLRMIRSDIVVNGGEDECPSTPHILNVSIPGIDNEFFVLQLDAKGISCSTKSSCLRDEEESYVLKAMKADSKTSIRFSFGRYTRKRDIIKAARIIADILHRG